jgi:hypothetical protein
MEKSLHELSDQFEMLMNEGLLLQGQYEEGETTFPALLDHIRSIQKVQGEIQNLMILQVTRFYGRSKVLRDKKTVTEAEVEKKKTISELGFGA